MSKKLSKDTFIEFSISAKGKLTSLYKNDIHLFFAKLGYHSGLIAFCELKKSFKACLYLDSFTKLKKIENSFTGWKKGKGLSASTKLLEAAEWRDKWMLDYKTQNLGSRFVIVPEWERKKWTRSKREPIYIEPGSAFGSGTHETTRLVIRLMEKEVKKAKAFFDMGLGTGILSLVAVKMGAERIDGIDHDREAVKVARGNLKRNKFKKPNLKATDLDCFKTNKKYDLVCANVWTPVLIRNKEKLVRMLRKSNHIIVSGILKKNRKQFLKDFKHKKLKTKKIIEGRRWMAVLYEKTV